MLSRAQLAALRQQLNDPGRFVERRVDKVCDLSGRHVRWESRQQIQIPDHEKLDGAPAIVSLGVWSKTRLPDLEVRDQTGRAVAILPRSERATTMAVVLVDTLAGENLSRLEADRAGDGDAAVVDGLVKQLCACVTRLLDGPKAVAQDHLSRYAATSRQIGNTDGLDEQLDRLRPFVDKVHVLASVVPDADGRVSLTVTYSQWQRRPSWRTIARRPWRWVKMQLSLQPTPFASVQFGANHAESFYLLVDAPDGVQVEDVYWERCTARPRPAQTDSYLQAESASQILSCYHHTHDAHGGRAHTELSLAGPPLRMAWLLVVVLSVAALLGLKELSAHDQETLVSAAALVPGALLAYVTERSGELAMRMSRWVRRLLLLVVILAVSYGFALRVDLVSGHSGVISDDSLGHLLLGVSLFGGLILGYVCWVRHWLLLLLRNKRTRRQAPARQEAGFRTWESRFASLVLALSIAALVLGVLGWWPLG